MSVCVAGSGAEGSKPSTPQEDSDLEGAEKEPPVPLGEYQIIAVVTGEVPVELLCINAALYNLVISGSGRVMESKGEVEEVMKQVSVFLCMLECVDACCVSGSLSC